jgi:hypothetical protein
LLMPPPVARYGAISALVAPMASMMPVMVYTLER